MRRQLERGERVYLVPHTIGAPAICYKQPRVTVVAVKGAYATVELDNGDQHDIHLDNIRITAPTPPKPRKAAGRPPRPLVLPDGWEEMPLC